MGEVKNLSEVKNLNEIDFLNESFNGKIHVNDEKK